MSLRWSPLLTLLLSLPGAALALELPAERTASEHAAAPTTSDGPADPQAAIDAAPSRIPEPPVGPTTEEAHPPVTDGARVPPDGLAEAAPQDGVQDAEPEATAATTAQDAEPPQLHRVELIDGQSLVGTLRSHDAHGVMLEIGDGPRIYLSRSTIAKVSPEAPAAERPLRPQAYFLAPSALLLKEGQGSFAQLELLLSEFSYGITDNLNFTIGSILPLWFASTGGGFNMLASVKAGGSVNEVVHLAAGAYGIFVPAALNSSVAVLGVGFGSVTVGTAEKNVTLSIGVPVAATAPVEGLIVNLSGLLRVSRMVSLTSELWTLPGDGGGNAWIWGGGTRLNLRPFSVDVGVLLLGQGGNIVPLPLPWLSAAYNFG
ncbi:MAG TPA: hypothetical protein VK013_13645 [Myxococcaceae bacterium]|nr:hypothetical protein [Myxococcaceae bacterium]